MLQGRHTVFVGAFFRRFTRAFSITSIIENEDMDFKFVVKELKLFRAMTDVSSITMKPEKRRGRAGISDKPAVERHAVFGLEVDVFERKAVIARRLRNLGEREKNKLFFHVTTLE